MVEVTSKPTDISKIQDIMNAISSNGGSDKTGLMVDYAAGSKLESGINELKMIGKEQAVYLKKMVGYQETILGKARREDVSSVATNNNVSDEKPRSALSAAGSAALMSVLGPLGPILGQLVSGVGLLGAGALAGRGVIRGGGGVDAARGGGGADRLPAVDSDTKPTKVKFTKKDFDLGTYDLTKEMRKAISGSGDFELTSKSPLMLYKDPVKSPLRLTEAMSKVISGSGDFELGDAKSLFNLSEEMRVKPKISDVPTKVIAGPPKMSKVPAALGTLLSGGMGYFDQELKDAGLNGMQRIGQGLLETIPGTIDMFVQGLVTGIPNSINNIIKGRSPADEEEFNLDLTPAFRKFMLNNVMSSQEETATMTREGMQSAADTMYGIDRDRQRISRNAPDLQVPSKAPTSQAAPIIIAPPAAPASSVAYSNNQQTTIVNQTKPVSASLYMHMLGGD